MKKFLFPIISILVACLLAAGATALALKYSGKGKITIGPWQTNVETGSGKAGAYLRAWVALNAPWALNSSEVLYFLAYEDSQGQTLDCNCVYKIEGTEPDTRWWSIAAYEDLHFIPNPINRYSLNVSTVETDNNYTFAIYLAPEAKYINWLPSCRNGGQLALCLRCYGPSDAFRANIAKAELPTITKISCR